MYVNTRIKSRIAMAKKAFSKKRALFTSKLDFSSKRKPAYLLHSFLWCWILDTSQIRSEIPAKFWNVVLEKDGEDQLHRLSEKCKTYHKELRSKTNWIGHILCRNCLLKRMTEGEIEGRIAVKGRQRRRRKQLLDDLQGKRWYWKMKEETLDRTL